MSIGRLGVSAETEDRVKETGRGSGTIEAGTLDSLQTGDHP